MNGGWQCGLLFVGVIFLAVIGIALRISAKYDTFVSYREINSFKPGAFSVGKDVK
jgi:hypothetical protein